MKKITALIMLLIMLVMFTGCLDSGTSREGIDSIKSYKEIPGVTEEEIAAVEELKKSRRKFLYGHLLETAAFRLDDRTFAGFTIEVCALLSELFGVDFVPLYCSEWNKLKEGIDDKTIDFAGNFTATAERAKIYSMTAPIAGHSIKIYTSATSDKIKEDSDIEGRKVGFTKGTVTEDMVKEHYDKMSFEVVYVQNFSQAAEMLKTGDIDAFIIDGAVDPHLEAYDFIKSRELFHPVYIPVSIVTANPELVPVIAVIDKYLKAGGINKFYSLYEKGSDAYKKQKLLQVLTAEEKAYIENLKKNGDTVKVAFEHDNYPISFYNKVDEQFQGISVDILAMVSRLTDIKFEPAVAKDESWPHIYERGKAGEIAMLDELLFSEERQQYFIWSTVPYGRSKYAIISKQDYPSIGFSQVMRASVGTLKHFEGKRVFHKTFPNYGNIKEYDTYYACLEALEKGEIDLLMASEYILLMQTNFFEKPGFKINFVFDMPMDLHFGFNKNEHILRSIVDKAQKYVPTDTITRDWTGRVFDYSQKISRMQTIYVSFFAGILALALIGMSWLLLKNKRLGKSLAERTATLSTIYEAIPDAIFTKDTEGFYSHCNAVFEKQTGLSEAEIIGKNYLEIFRERAFRTADTYREIDERVMHSGAKETVEGEIIYPDGSRKILETVRAPLIQNGKVVGLLGIGRDVTERKEVKSRLERIINTAQIVFVLSVDGVIVEANEYCTKHIGAKVGDDPRIFYNNPRQREAIINDTRQVGTISNAVVKFKMIDGEVHRFLATYTFTEYDQRPAYLMWALDVEQERIKSDLLQAAQESFHTVLDVLPMPVRIVERESGQIVYVNDSLLELLEYNSPDEVCGLKIEDILPEVLSDGTPSKERMELLMAKESGSISLEMEYLTKNGKVIEAMVVSRQINYNGKRSSIAIIKDLAEEKERAQILKDAAEREKEANQLKSQFLANMSHEIRTPMNGIIGMTDLLLSERLSDRQMYYVKDVKASAESLLDIINDILDLSRIGEGKLQLIPMDVELNRVLKNIVSMMSFSAKSKGLEFIDNIHLNTPEFVYVDDVRLQQIIVNLLSNAIKFTKTGHVKLSVRIEDGDINIEVSDTGVGIREEDIPLIFGAFEQVDRRKNRAIKGTGLGLSIVKSLVSMMEGNIWVQSEYGIGTTFYVAIPYEPGDETAVKTIEQEFSYISAPTAKILLVDDIQTNLTVGAGLLRMCGITADVALSGYEAIELVKAKHYDIVFMDHMMPEMDGIETMQFIKSMGGDFANLPIIALTANAVNESREMLLASGMNDFLSKPIDRILLMDILLKWLPSEKIKTTAIKPETAQSASYTAALNAAARIEGLDIELALSRIDGMQDVLEAAIKQVAETMSDVLKKMDGFLAESNLRNFSIEAHGLKGALSNIGATPYSEFAAELEIASKADNKPLCVDKFAVFVDKMEVFAAKLQTIFSPTPQTKEKPHGDKTFLAAKIDEAIMYLEIFETMDALNCLSALEEFSFGEEIDAKLDVVKKTIDTFCYDDAILLLGEIKDSLN